MDELKCNMTCMCKFRPCGHAKHHKYKGSACDKGFCHMIGREICICKPVNKAEKKEVSLEANH